MVLGPVLPFRRAYVIRLSRSVADQQAREVAFAREREALLRRRWASPTESGSALPVTFDGVILIQLVSAMVLRTATIARGLRREEHVSPERLATTLAGLDRITLEMQAVAGDLRGLMGALVPLQLGQFVLGGLVVDAECGRGPAFSLPQNRSATNGHAKPEHATRPTSMHHPPSG